jgi:serine/threonine protein phosphatase PrpC
VTSTVAATGEQPAEVAGALVSWANEQGGHDNVTVALARVQGEPGAEEDTAPGAGG